MKTLLALLVLTLPAFADRDVTFSWDEQPGVHFRVYRNNEFVTASETNSATLSLPDGASEITVTAVNSIGESDHSASLRYPDMAMVKLEFQESTDLKNWTTTITLTMPATGPVKFYRQLITHTP